VHPDPKHICRPAGAYDPEPNLPRTSPLSPVNPFNASTRNCSMQSSHAHLPSFPPSLPPSFTHSLTHSLTHSAPPLLPRCLIDSLRAALSRRHVHFPRAPPFPLGSPAPGSCSVGGSRGARGGHGVGRSAVRGRTRGVAGAPVLNHPKIHKLASTLVSMTPKP
jgi:hypothetical protein